MGAKAETDFIDELPETRGGARRVVDEELEELLRSNPNRWKFIMSSSTSSSYAKPRYLGDDFEWTQRKVDGVHNYYCRYVGNGA